MTKPIAVLISDIHYNIQTLPIADAAMRLAIARANALNVDLIVAGDLHDTKAHMRGECVNAMLKTFSTVKHSVYILRGNHDSINEKSQEHSLEFLRNGPGDITIVAQLPYVPYNMDVVLIPYRHDSNELAMYLKEQPRGPILIMHQGLKSSNPGDYIQDKSAISPEDVAGLRVISGHYHTRQTIDLPDGGKWDYIGNPYTLNFAEANDPEKGFQILMSDGSLEFVPTNLRKHVVLELQTVTSFKRVGYTYQNTYVDIQDNDIILVKARGRQEHLAMITKERVKQDLKLVQDFRLDLIPDETEATATEEQVSQLSQPELLDSMIESIDTDMLQKSRLKTLWKDLK